MTHGASLPSFSLFITSKKLISSIHVTDLTSAPESLCLIVRRSRAAAAATLWIMMVDRVSEIVNVMVDPVSCWLIIIILADPVSCWHLIMVVDHDRGGS